MRLRIELVVFSVLLLIQHFCFAGTVPSNSTASQNLGANTTVTRSVSVSSHNLTISKGNITSGNKEGSASTARLERNATVEALQPNVTTAAREGNLTVGRSEGNVTTENLAGRIMTRGSEEVVNITTTTERSISSTTITEDAAIPGSNLTSNKINASTGGCPLHVGPLILRPKEVPTVEPVLIPFVPPKSMTCSRCGKTEQCDKPRSCSVCSHCGRSLIDSHQTKFTRSNEKPQSSVSSGESPGNEKSPVLPNPGKEQEPILVPVEADVSLSRKEILQRRLNFQRAQEFMRSIQPKESIQPNVGTPEPIITLNGRAVKLETPMLRDDPNAGAPSTFTDKIKWFFGMGGEKAKPQQVRSSVAVPTSTLPQSIHENPGHHSDGNKTRGIFECPLAKLQRMKELRAAAGQ